MMGMSNLRLVLMIIACAAAALTHFNGSNFPDNRMIVLAAIVGYCIISAALQLMAWLVDGNTLIQTQPKEVRFLL
jgi:hypothetical protein